MFCPVRCLFFCLCVFSGSCLALAKRERERERESWLLCLSLVCGVCTVCHGLFTFPLGVIGRLCSVIVALSGHLLYYSRTSMARTPMARLPWMSRTRS